MNEQSFSVHGIDLRFTTNSQALAGSISELLGHFAHEVQDPSGAIKVQFEAMEKRADIPMLVTDYDPAVARQEFVALTQLVQQTDCYRLHFGRDALDLPWLITPLLQARQVRMRH